VFGSAGSVGNPNFHSGNLNVAIDEWVKLQRTVIIIPKIMRQKEVSIIIVFQSEKFKIGNGRAAFGCNGSCFRFLFGENPCNCGFAKLKLCFYPKKTLRSLN